MSSIEELMRSIEVLMSSYTNYNKKVRYRKDTFYDTLLYTDDLSI